MDVRGELVAGGGGGLTLGVGCYRMGVWGLCWGVGC